MDSSSSSTQWIDRYLQGQLDAEAQAAFEQRVAQDPTFAAEVKRQIEAEYTVRQAARAERFAHFNGIYDEEAPLQEAVGVRRLWPYATALAAAVALLLLLFWPQPQTPQELYQAYQEAPQPASFYKSEQNTDRNRQALEAYNQAEYQQAIDLLQARLADSSLQRPNTLRYYLGLSYLYAYDQARADDIQPDASYLPQAIQALQQVEAGSAFGQQAQWQLAMAYLRADRAEEARRLLRNIADNQAHYRQSRAQEVLAAWR